MLQNLIPALKRSNHDSGGAIDVVEEGGPKGIKTKGPQRWRYQASGQARRRATRREAAAMRKMNSRRRRAWMAKQQADANARGKIAVLKRPEIATPALRANVVRGLERKYGNPVEQIDETQLFADA